VTVVSPADLWWVFVAAEIRLANGYDVHQRLDVRGVRCGRRRGERGVVQPCGQSAWPHTGQTRGPRAACAGQTVRVFAPDPSPDHAHVNCRGQKVREQRQGGDKAWVHGTGHFCEVK
jgi:hypothetical protein